MENYCYTFAWHKCDHCVTFKLRVDFYGGHLEFAMLALCNGCIQLYWFDIVLPILSLEHKKCHYSIYKLKAAFSLACNNKGIIVDNYVCYRISSWLVTPRLMVALSLVIVFTSISSKKTCSHIAKCSYIPLFLLMYVNINYY